MKVTIKLFAAAKQIAGTDSIELSCSENSTVSDLKGKLVEQLPDLESIVSHARFAINADFATDDTLVQENSEIACIPPVSGG
jgi:molybdopterin converting factor subunit 1